MTQEDKELLFKDLSSRLPYGVKCWASYNKFPTTLVDVNADVVGDNLFIVTVKLKKTGLNSPSLIEDIKPYLRPMSSMTEEEAKELSILCDITGVLSIKITDEYIDFEVDDGFSSIETKIIWYNDIISSIEIFDWLNKNHFDYRGLIPMGLAIAVTKENNPYKK